MSNVRTKWSRIFAEKVEEGEATTMRISKPSAIAKLIRLYVLFLIPIWSAPARQMSDKVQEWVGARVYSYSYFILFIQLNEMAIVFTIVSRFTSLVVVTHCICVGTMTGDLKRTSISIENF